MQEGENDRAALTEVMDRLAQGDAAALVTLIDRFGSPIAAALRRIAGARGCRVGPDAMDELVLDAAMELGAHASSWSPDGGAAPWVWAHHQLARVVDRHIGQYADELDASVTAIEASPAGPSSEPEVLEVVASLSRRHPEVSLLAEAVEQVASPRDRVLFFETALQASMGDRSPAKTVGEAHGLAAASVRQQQRRVKLRLRHLADTDPRFAPLRHVALVA